MSRATAEQQGLALLTIHQKDRAARSLQLHGEGYRIGRDADMEIRIDHAAVSRLHALLQKQGRHWILKDQGSTNGLWWQGRRVQQLELQDGDRISFAPAHDAENPWIAFEQPAQRRLQRIKRSLGISILFMLGSAGIVLTLAAVNVPVRGRLASVRGPLAIFDGNNKPLKSVDSNRHRELKSVEAFSPLLIDALLSSEDNRFWWHPGVDPVGTVRAFAANLTGGRVLEGGSSLTQQLARSLYPDLVGEGDTLGRKLRELLVALQLPLAEAAFQLQCHQQLTPLQQAGAAAELPEQGLPRCGLGI